MKLSEEIEELHKSGDAGNWCKGWAERAKAMEDALEVFASNRVWRLNGVCDPTGPAFEGQDIAMKALEKGKRP